MPERKGLCDAVARVTGVTAPARLARGIETWSEHGFDFAIVCGIAAASLAAFSFLNYTGIHEQLGQPGRRPEHWIALVVMCLVIPVLYYPALLGGFAAGWLLMAPAMRVALCANEARQVFDAVQQFWRHGQRRDGATPDRPAETRFRRTFATARRFASVLYGERI